MEEELNRVVTFNDKSIEIIKVLFHLAFNLNLRAVENVEVRYNDGKNNAYNEREFFRITIGFKSYYLMVDKEFNVACCDGDLDRTYPSEYRPVANQIKIAYFLTNHDVISDVFKENLEIV
jgi:hypothetical protein